ncbi:MAG: hypothetical protein M1480_13005 [Bacteroidetes bacterium]|nr:hypothetical protein [Bacteroidota bacterium]
MVNRLPSVDKLKRLLIHIYLSLTPDLKSGVNDRGTKNLTVSTVYGWDFLIHTTGYLNKI